MKFVNGWKYIYKDRDRIDVHLRLGVVTVFRLYADISDKKFIVTLFNFRLEV